MFFRRCDQKIVNLPPINVECFFLQFFLNFFAFLNISRSLSLQLQLISAMIVLKIKN
jgi:hypothetical protein